MPNYSVNVKAYATVIVLNAESESHALEIAEDFDKWSLEVDELSVDGEIPDDRLESEIRHSSEVIDADG